MSTSPDRAAVVSLVQSSPRFVAAHDKQGWLGIFGAQHVVEDPVGAPPVCSEDAGALARFWDAFIAPNDIEFHVNQDWIDGHDVVRDVTIVTTMPAGVVVSTPAHLIYQTGVEAGVLKVRRMAAHWETVPVVRQLMHPTRAHLRAGVDQTSHLVRTLGVRPSVRFFGAAHSVGRRGKRVLRAHLAAEGITEISKIIASGRWVTASIMGDGGPALVMAEFARGSLDLSHLRIYTDRV